MSDGKEAPRWSRAWASIFPSNLAILAGFLFACMAALLFFTASALVGLIVAMAFLGADPFGTYPLDDAAMLGAPITVIIGVLMLVNHYAQSLTDGDRP